MRCFTLYRVPLSSQQNGHFSKHVCLCVVNERNLTLASPKDVTGLCAHWHEIEMAENGLGRATIGLTGFTIAIVWINLLGQALPERIGELPVWLVYTIQ